MTSLADLVRRIRLGVLTDDPTGDGGEQLPPAPNWLTVTDQALAVAWLTHLTAWISDVWTIYRAIPGCWAWHPTAVAELLVCQHLWRDAVRAGMGPIPLATWHDRWRPGTARRVDLTLAGCERSHGIHLTGSSATWTYDTAVLDELAVWWATTHGSSPPPGLTRCQNR